MRRQPIWVLPVLLAGLCGCSSESLPTEYRELTVPRERLASAEARAHGRQLYLRHCALCHGEQADGHGVRRNLSSRPQDFNDPAWRRRSTPERIFHTIREGVRGTAMPAWKTFEEDDTWDLVAYLLGIAEHGPG